VAEVAAATQAQPQLEAPQEHIPATVAALAAKVVLNTAAAAAVLVDMPAPAELVAIKSPIQVTITQQQMALAAVAVAAQEHIMNIMAKLAAAVVVVLVY
jgi:hypothetical protein